MKILRFSIISFAVLCFSHLPLSEQSVLKVLKNSLPILDSSLSGFQNDLAVPRREDDYTLLARDEDQEIRATTEIVQFDEEDDEVQTTTVLSSSLKQSTEEKEEISDSGLYATFGSGYRPVFPVEPLNTTSTNNVNKQSSTATFSGNLPPPLKDIGIVDVALAKLANINVFASNSSQLDVFASKSGLNCSCGVPRQDNTTRIVNGVPVKINQLPWTAALFKRNWLGFYGSKPYCGGSLINNLYVVTASHCVDGHQARTIKVRLNEEDTSKLNENEEGYKEFQVSEIIMHENYDRRKIENDIALLKLSSPVELKEGNVIAPVCLPANNKNDLTSYTAWVSGWGTVSQGGSASNVLRQVQVPIMSNEDCNANTVYTGKVSENMLCAGYLEGGKDACQGDSGGPLIISNNEKRTLVGIVSWGYGCAKPKAPGVYTRVGRYADWILANTKGGDWCAT